MTCPGGVCAAPAAHHASTVAPASLIVTLPADAKLSIDDHLTTSTSDTRQFTTPSLSSERDYHYTLKAEVVRGGQVVSVSKDVTVRGGQETRISLDIPETVAAK